MRYNAGRTKLNIHQVSCRAGLMCHATTKNFVGLATGRKLLEVFECAIDPGAVAGPRMPSGCGDDALLLRRTDPLYC